MYLVITIDLQSTKQIAKTVDLRTYVIALLGIVNQVNVACELLTHGEVERTLTTSAGVPFPCCR